MGLFDGYFDPQQFQDSGGLLGRLLSLQQQQGQYQPGAGFDPTIPSDGSPPVPLAPISLPATRPTVQDYGQTSTDPRAQGYGPTQNIAVGDHQMPQFGSAPVPQPAPDLGDRLSAGLQSWANTPVGNPFAALANGIAGFGAGQRTDAAGIAPAQTLGRPPDLGDRLSAGFQSWAHTPVGNPFAAIANGIAGMASGQRADPAGTAQQIVQPRSNPSGNSNQDLHSQYQALRPILGDQNAMLAIVHPEFGKTLIAQALAGQVKSGSAAEANRVSGGGAGPGVDATSIAGGRPPGLVKVGYLEVPINPNQASGELLGIQQRKEEHTISGEDYVSGVRDGNVRRNDDKSLDVTNGTGAVRKVVGICLAHSTG